MVVADTASSSSTADTISSTELAMGTPRPLLRIPIASMARVVTVHHLPRKQTLTANIIQRQVTTITAALPVAIRTAATEIVIQHLRPLRILILPAGVISTKTRAMGSHSRIIQLLNRINKIMASSSTASSTASPNSQRMIRRPTTRTKGQRISLTGSKINNNLTRIRAMGNKIMESRPLDSRNKTMGVNTGSRNRTRDIITPPGLMTSPHLSMECRLPLLPIPTPSSRLRRQMHRSSRPNLGKLCLALHGRPKGHQRHPLSRILMSSTTIPTLAGPWRLLSMPGRSSRTLTIRVIRLRRGLAGLSLTSFHGLNRSRISSSSSSQVVVVVEPSNRKRHPILLRLSLVALGRPALAAVRTCSLPSASSTAGKFSTKRVSSAPSATRPWFLVSFLTAKASSSATRVITGCNPRVALLRAQCRKPRLR
mmetsp:Transcript_35140/g.80140  ORF Transcript_35140/g.80140 Transcript_35140/m.80140 type:complete len:424 (-) Transcript_35140:465-1736(-)